MAAQRPPASDPAGLASSLGHAAHGVVTDEDIRWEPSRGWFADLVLGRPVWFAVAPKAGECRDLYRARYRVTPSGQLLQVGTPYNVTRTPLGDDAGLELVGRHAVFATLAYGRIQGIGVLELDGIRREDRGDSLLDRALLAVTNYQSYGTTAGLGRTDIVLETPATVVELELGSSSLQVSLGANGRALRYELTTRQLRAGDGSQAFGATSIIHRHPPKPLVHWAVDTVRDVVGPEPIAWLEQEVFGAKDSLKRAAFALTADASSKALKAPGKTVEKLDAAALAKLASAWPPPPLASQWQQVEPGEGQWAPADVPFLRPSLAPPGKEAPPPYFYLTYVRPDARRPYAKLWLVAMDMRQLELAMQAGFEDPEPLTGPPGDGHLPDDPAVVNRVVATFNGAFKSEHGRYGMMASKRVLLPPVVGAASVIVTDDHAVGMGSWPKADKVPDEVVAFRQNLDPLVEDGVPNPTNRQLWGWQIQGKSVLTERTALCVTPAGQLYYAWGEEIDGPTLGRALGQVGCSYGMHLDMNPGHCGFVFTRVDDLKKHEFTVRRAVPKMSIPPDRYVRWSAKDFFYVMLRQPAPRAVPGTEFQVDGGVQPPPAWWPGIFRAQLDAAGLGIELLDIEPGRVDWKLTAGTAELSLFGSPPHQTALAGELRHRVLLALGVGTTTRATRYGLAFDGKATLALRGKAGTVVLSAERGMRIESAEQPPALNPGDEVVQLPLLVRDGQMLPEANAQGPLRPRAALCAMNSGRVLIARATTDSNAPLANALSKAGCRTVVELDRGSSHPPFIHRAGTEQAPSGDYETTVLYALGRSMTPPAFRWKPDGSAPSSRPTLYDIPAPRKK